MGFARTVWHDLRAGTGRAPTLTVVLFLGFGLTLGLWLMAGYQFTRRVAAVEREGAAINERYMRAQELLSTVRTQILLISVYVRDALLQADSVALDDTRRRLKETYGAISTALDQYVPVLESPIDEQDRIAILRREIESYRESMEGTLADPDRRPSDARKLLNERVVPRRELVIRLSDEVQSLNRSAFVRQQDNMAGVYRTVQRQLWQQLGAAVAASLGIAFFAILYAGRLEHRIRSQSARDTQNRRELQQLSAKLVSVQEEERRTIARELHDEIGQALTAIKVELAVAQRALETTARPVPSLETVRSITDGALQSVRDLSHLLHPAVLDDLGLPAAIEWYAHGFEKRYSIPVDVLHEGVDERLAPEIETAAYRIVQEALTNVARHSRATEGRVCLQRREESLSITVQDNGVGFDRHAHRRQGGAPGLGLIGIRERSSELGGTFHIDTGPGRGTRLTVVLTARARPGETIESESNQEGPQPHGSRT